MSSNDNQPKANSEVSLGDAKASGFLAFLCFVFPLMGFVIWLQWKNVSKSVAKPYGIATLVGFLIFAVGGIVVGIVAMTLLDSMIKTIMDAIDGLIPSLGGGGGEGEEVIKALI